MKYSVPGKKYGALCCCLLALSAMIFFSCQKELSGDGILPSLTKPDLTTKCTSSVSGFVTDENEVPVQGAFVKVGTANTTTDKFGYFEVNDVQVIQNAAVITVTQPGYFKGIKTYLAAESKAAFFRIKLIPKTNVGSIDAATGGTVRLNGMSITLPAAAVVTAAGNAVYTGAVTVSAQWISPTAIDLQRKMPGDLRGLDSLGQLKSLTTYGMTAVELTGENGELLQIAPGKKATLAINIPTSIISAAPANLPLWYFDENTGLWMQEGNAVKTGTQYIGEVGHFSFWNCDVPGNYIKFSAIFLDAAGKPVQNTLVKISVSTDLQNGRSGFTDSTGFISGAIPANAQLVLQVFSDYGCSNPVYSQNISSGNTDFNGGSIIIPDTKLAKVTGKVVNCSNAAVTNGFVIMLKDGYSFRYQLNSTGGFIFNTTLCNNGSDVTLISQDATALQEGTTTVTLNFGDNAVGNLQACGISTEEFINYSINGANYLLSSPDSILHQPGTPLTFISGGLNRTGSGVSFSFTESGIAVGSVQTLDRFWSVNIDSSAVQGVIPVNITEYGAIGQFIAGNFAGTLIGPTNAMNLVTCSFRVRRKR